MRLRQIIGFGLVAILIVSALGLLYLTDWDTDMVTAMVAGVLGATVATMRAFYGHQGDKFDPAFTAWYSMRPLVGGVGGLVAILAVQLGLVVFATEAGPSPVGAVVLAGLAGGYAFKDALGTLDEFFVGEDTAAERQLKGAVS